MYGKIEICQEGNKDLVAETGSDDNGNGFFKAASVYSIKEFMNGNEMFLKSLIESVLFYSEVYDAGV